MKKITQKELDNVVGGKMIASDNDNQKCPCFIRCREDRPGLCRNCGNLVFNIFGGNQCCKKGYPLDFKD